LKIFAISIALMIFESCVAPCIAVEGYKVSPSTPVAYIFSSDTASADSYKSLLQDNGYSATLIPMSEVATTDLSIYDLIIVGNDTGFKYEWGDSASVSAIQNSEKPIIGLGFGGACLFQQMGLSINWGHGMLWTGSSIYVVEPEHDIFNSPNPISVPADHIVQLYSPSCTVLGEYAPALSANVTLLGHDVSYTEHYPLVQEGQSLLWGFTAAPDSMTQVGKDLFINVVDYMAGQPAREKPDLIITDIWNEDVKICYQIRNIGEAIAPKGHYTYLFVDGVRKASSYVNTDLSPGERFRGCFEYDWQCTSRNDTIKVCADYLNNVSESNETNNCREETWRCDVTAPEIVSRIGVSNISTNSAVISWDTNEESDSVVRYDRVAGEYSYEKADSALVKKHRIALTGLEASTSYHFIVQSTDACGNTVRSKDFTFKTLPLPDDEPPTVSIEAPDVCRGIVEISAVAFDNIGVDRVEFYIKKNASSRSGFSLRSDDNDTPIFIDYSKPYRFFLNTSEYKDDEYRLVAKAIDLYGRYKITEEIININNTDITNPYVEIINPKDGDILDYTVAIKVYATDYSFPPPWTIAPPFEPVSRVEIYIDDELYISTTTSSQVYYFTFPWNTKTVGDGQHTIVVKAYDSAENSASDSINVTVKQPVYPSQPVIEVQRGLLEWHNNFFTTSIEVSNIGNEEVKNVVIYDYLSGLQCVEATNPDYEVQANPKDYTVAKIKIHDPLLPGQSVKCKYDVIPILSPQPLIGYVIGYHTWITYNDSSGVGYSKKFEVPFPLTLGAVNYAFSHADYLIVTNPSNLLLFNSKKDVSKLLSSMAELAKLKNGVLGYLSGVPASFPRDYEIHDGFAVGDIGGDPEAEILIADRDKNKVYVYNPDGAELHSWEVPTKNYEDEDGFAVGDVDGDGEDEVVFAEKDGSTIYILNAKNGSIIESQFEYKHGYEAYNGLAVGDVIGDGNAEILVADRSDNKVYVYNTTGSELNSFHVDVDYNGDYEKYDGFAVGDVIPDEGKEEIIIADKSANSIFIYEGDSDGTPTWLFPADFDEGDGLAVGDIDGDGKEDILVADYDKNAVYSYYGLQKKTVIPFYDFHGDKFNGFAVGNVAGDEKAEILIANREDDSIDIYEAFSAEASKYILHDLTEKGGAWSSKLKDDWTSEGYMLIVGENEIIPAWGGKSWKKESKWGCIYSWCLYSKTIDTVKTDLTDYPYASTCGKEIKPELSIGRIIGNNAKKLRKPIETSIGVYKGLPGYEFDRSHALVVSGYPTCLDGGCDYINFKNEADGVADRLIEKGVNVIQMHTPDYTQYNLSGEINVTATKAAIKNAFFANTPNKDVVHLAGHGNKPVCDEIHRNDVNGEAAPFGPANPFVFASSCLTGRYVGITSLAEAFLNKGAGVYLGATESGRCCSHSNIAKKFYENWETYQPIGSAVKETKRSLGSDAYEKFWSAIYHVYGDPKFGWEGPLIGGVTSLALSAQAAAPSSVNVIIPDYKVTRVDGEDRVEIPGGYALFMPGMPLVPYYKVFYEYPRDYQIQDVVLTNRSEPITATGLNISDCVIAIPGRENHNQSQQLEKPEWWPEKAFEWTTFESPESTTLAITIYPFYYNSLTTDVKFYKNYSFNINYTVPTVEITKLETDKHIYERGEKVAVDIELDNSGTEKEDVLVDAVIREESSDRVVSGLYLRSLKDLRGKAAFSSIWNSSGFEPGYYGIEVELKDVHGVLLDRKMESFRLGVSSGEITRFTATPEIFDPGDEINISMTFNNTGTVNITGNAIIKILNSSGDMVEMFTHNITNLIPSENVSFCDTWNTSGAEEGSYDIVGYVSYDGKVTDPVTAVVSSRAEIGIFDTGPGTYPSISGTHNGTITPSQTITVKKLYTYPCPGTGGHTEYAMIWNNTMGECAVAEWNGYSGDYHNISFNRTLTLEGGVIYNYTIRTGSYPQIIHESPFNATGGEITCTEFVDANGNVYYDWIPAIKLWS